MKQTPVFSIIIPHKNTLDLLIRCLKSIPEMDDIQVIVIDDNSNEDLVDFSILAGLADDNVEVHLTKEGKGAGYARNIGLKYAKGKWLLFADADDFFVENAFDCLFAYADSDEEMIFFKSVGCYSDTGIPLDRTRYFNRMIDSYNKKNKYSEEYLRYYWYVPWARMIKREIVIRENILFDEIKYSNDIKFSYLIGYYAASVKTSNDIIYSYTLSKGSLTNVRTFQVYKSRYIVYLEENVFLREKGISYMQMSSFNKLVRCLFEYGLLSFIDLVKVNILYKDNPFVNFSIAKTVGVFFSFLQGKKNKSFFSTSYK